MIFSIIIFILTLLVLVVIHELGHFLVAKKFGIKVEEFGFGIPPKIWGKKIGETLYSLNALPIGGFVRLLGEDEVGDLSNKAGASRDFRAKPVIQRILVVVAGVVMNLLLAWVLFYVFIISQNFKVIYPVPDQGVFIDFVQKDFPAYESGVKVGDRILKVDGKEVKQFDEVRNLIKAKKGEQLSLTLSDIEGKKQRQINLTPKKVEEDDYLIGVKFTPFALRQYITPVEKIFSGITYSWDLTKLTFQGFSKLISDIITGNFQTVSQSVSGPVGLASASNDILSGGRQALPIYIWFVGIISLTLAIFNVLPIPALDGGRLLFLLIEAIFKRKVSENIERVIHQVGFLLLIGLAVLVTYSDISKLIHK